MKKLEVVLYIAAIVILAFLYKQEIIDEASIGLAIGLIVAVKGLVYQKDVIKAEREEKRLAQEENFRLTNELRLIRKKD